MGSSLRLTLRAGERLFINGAVLKADRKVAIELLNGADFLLEQHLLPAEAVRSTDQHLYYCIQAVLLTPFARHVATDMCRRAIAALARTCRGQDELARLRRLERLIEQHRAIDALKELRATCLSAQSARALPSPRA